MYRWKQIFVDSLNHLPLFIIYIFHLKNITLALDFNGSNRAVDIKMPNPLSCISARQFDSFHLIKYGPA